MKVWSPFELGLPLGTRHTAIGGKLLTFVTWSKFSKGEGGEMTELALENFADN